MLRLILGGAAVYRCDPRAKFRRLDWLRKNSAFVSGYRFSDTASSSKSEAPFGGWAIPLFPQPVQPLKHQKQAPEGRPNLAPRFSAG